MKQLLFCLTLLATFSVATRAQQATIFYNGNSYGDSDTIECTLPHGVMLEVDGLSVRNDESESVTYKLAVYYRSGADISVGGICTRGGQCTSGDESANFEVGASETYSGLSLEMIVPDEIAEGSSTLFLVAAIAADQTEVLDPTVFPHTWMRVRCATNGIDNNADVRLALWPNPTTNRLTLDAESLPANSMLMVYNTIGQLTTALPLAGVTTIATTEWPAGSYRCVVMNNGNMIASKQVLVVR